ncbi:ribosome maturation factor RimP [Pseudomonadales bacterium]|nr:ribosome maturation factor RimP [Pseudomonadales bacterium]MDG1001101.1 ribosome maturation factor RimP [Pseudomonadales bacterium]MDG1306308.1 ribosome maturation factor RimP [Pseudomonadales bacterium]MDG1834930.1 ribosome maturation factor RimP [Pseudomonadales bacterium]
MSTQLRSLIEPVVTGMGFELWGVEYLTQGRYSVLKIFIDSENGIDVDDCASVSRQVGSLLDVEEPLRGQYTLEVSSPGMDRRLFTFEQFDLMKGFQVKLKLNKPFDGKKRFTGLLVGTEDKEVVLRVGEEETLFPYEMIDRANVVPEI